MSIYTLPDLPYDYSALEPHISGAIMELHHDKHHANYVAQANLAVEQLTQARENGYIDVAAGALTRNLAFNLGGHTNHSIFWKNLTPNGVGSPEGELAAAIDDQFGSFDAFRAHFTAVALTLQGSGWAVLGYEPISGKLIIEQLTDQHGNITVSLVPIVLIDMWEHAFYLDYKNVKADYVKAWWNIVNWEDAGERFAAATSHGPALLH